MLMLAVTIVFIAYAVYMNLIYDPQGASFLAQKSSVERPANERLWATIMQIHVITACLALASGAANFSNRLLKWRPRIHRIIGYVYVGAILIVDLTSGYMAPFATGGKLTSIPFNLINIAWPAMTVAAIVSVRRQRIKSHRRWMIRSFAFCFTNMVLHLIRNVLHEGFGLPYILSYILGVYGSIILIVIAAEIIIRRTG